MTTFFEEQELLNCEDEELKKILAFDKIDEEHNIFYLNIIWDGESDYTELLEFHGTDHFVVLGKYEIWAEIMSLYVSIFPKPGRTYTLDVLIDTLNREPRYNISIIFQFY